jgi:hypothetical protein
MNRGRSAREVVGFVASVITIVGVGFAAFKLPKPDHSVPATAESKQVVSFRQVTNRMCVENQWALKRALLEAQPKVQLLAFLSRGTGWGVNDLESVSAPASLADQLSSEIAIRRRVQGDLLEIQHAGETGDLEAKAQAEAAIAGAETSAVEVEHELGLRRCAPVLPAKVRRAAGVS